MQPKARMKLCELTFPAPEQNLACDEALLELSEAGRTGALLRFWEPAEYCVVLGYANKAATETHLDFCRAHAIPVLRRCTGGGTVLQGPGCLNYSLVLPIQEAPWLDAIHSTNQFVLERHREAVSRLLHAPVERRGDTDLAIGGLKFSGNAQRRRRRCLLFHGCFLLDLDLALVEKSLRMPSRQPDYRLNRSHSDFLMNLRIDPLLLKQALRKSWDAQEPLTDIPFGDISRLAQEKYLLDEWNFKF